MRTYRETFRRHRVLFSLPAVLFAVIAGVLTFGAPSHYQSIANLWVDNGPTAGSSLGNSTQTTEPSTVEQTLLNELLATQSFDVAVGDASALGHAERAGGGTQEAIANRIAKAVQSGAGSATPGPQVLELTFKGSSPQVAQSALSALVARLQSSATTYTEDFGKSAQSYYGSQVTTAQQAVNRASAAADSYHAAHPSATTQNNEAYAALAAAVTSANSQLATATSSLDQAQEQASGSGGGTTVRVVDSASLPTTPTSGKKKAAMAVVGGAIGGGLLSLLIIIAMTPSGEDGWDAGISSAGRLPNSLPLAPAPVLASASAGPALLGAADGFDEPARGPASIQQVRPIRALSAGNGARPGTGVAVGSARDGARAARAASPVGAGRTRPAAIDLKGFSRPAEGEKETA